MTRGQTAIEMVLIIVFVLLLAATAIVMSSNTVTGLAASVNNVQIIPK